MKTDKIFTTKNILGWAIGFVMMWFGAYEILSPKDWITFVPDFISSSMLGSILVVIHGTILSICGLSLILNYYRKTSAVIISLMLLEIVINLTYASGFSDIVVRDIGLLGATVALLFNGQQEKC